MGGHKGGPRRAGLPAPALEAVHSVVLSHLRLVLVHYAGQLAVPVLNDSLHFCVWHHLVLLPGVAIEGHVLDEPHIQRLRRGGTTGGVTCTR
eukprot:1194518-Prorocentrum_minimum.AAC.9